MLSELLIYYASLAVFRCVNCDLEVDQVKVSVKNITEMTQLDGHGFAVLSILTCHLSKRMLPKTSAKLYHFQVPVLYMVVGGCIQVPVF